MTESEWGTTGACGGGLINDIEISLNDDPIYSINILISELDISNTS